MKKNPKVVRCLVQKLKGEILDFASLENARAQKDRKRKNVTVPSFEFATCPCIPLNPDNPKWLKKVEAYVKFHYDELVKNEKLINRTVKPINCKV